MRTMSLSSLTNPQYRRNELPARRPIVLQAGAVSCRTCEASVPRPHDPWTRQQIPRSARNDGAAPSAGRHLAPAAALHEPGGHLFLAELRGECGRSIPSPILEVDLVPHFHQIRGDVLVAPADGGVQRGFVPRTLAQALGRRGEQLLDALQVAGAERV